MRQSFTSVELKEKRRGRRWGGGKGTVVNVDFQNIPFITFIFKENFCNRCLYKYLVCDFFCHTELIEGTTKKRVAQRVNCDLPKSNKREMTGDFQKKYRIGTGFMAKKYRN